MIRIDHKRTQTARVHCLITTLYFSVSVQIANKTTSVLLQTQLPSPPPVPGKWRMGVICFEEMISPIQ